MIRLPPPSSRPTIDETRKTPAWNSSHSAGRQLAAGALEPLGDLRLEPVVALEDVRRRRSWPTAARTPRDGSAGRSAPRAGAPLPARSAYCTTRSSVDSVRSRGTASTSRTSRPEAERAEPGVHHPVVSDAEAASGRTRVVTRVTAARPSRTASGRRARWSAPSSPGTSAAGRWSAGSPGPCRPRRSRRSGRRRRCPGG